MHPGDDKVLVGSQAYLTAILSGKAPRLDELLAAHPPDRHVEANVVEPLLLLRMDAHVVAPVVLGEVLPRGRKLEAGALLQFLPEALGTELLYQVTHPI